MKAPLPLIEGVAPSRQRLRAGPWKTVLEFLAERFPAVGREAWLGRMARGLVVDESGTRLDAESPYRAGACVFYYREPEAEREVPFEERVVYRDAHLLVVDKPHFLPVVPAGRFLRESLLVRLRRRGMPEQLAPVHRIDRETAGLVLFSLEPATRGLYAALFRERRVRKVYEALVATAAGHEFPLTRRSRVVPGEPFFRMKEAEGEPNSETRVGLLERREGGGALLRVEPLTGRKHQVRLHLSASGMPIVNDRLYPVVWPEGEDDFSRPLKLLAKSISFTDPRTNEERYFESERAL